MFIPEEIMNAMTHEHPSRTASDSGGFTLVEMLMVTSILTFLTILALPSLTAVVANNRLRAAGTDLMSSVLLARSEAIKRNGRVQILPASASDWTSGWRVQVVSTGEQLDNIGLLWDFKDLKGALGEIIERFDHQYLNDLEPFKVENPSAENMARYFYRETSSKLRTSTNGRVQVKDVTVWETETTTAKYSE